MRWQNLPPENRGTSDFGFGGRGLFRGRHVRDASAVLHDHQQGLFGVGQQRDIRDRIAIHQQQIGQRDDLGHARLARTGIAPGPGIIVRPSPAMIRAPAPALIGSAGICAVWLPSIRTFIAPVNAVPSKTRTFSKTTAGQSAFREFAPEIVEKKPGNRRPENRWSVLS
jgi:hypothetical protein